MATFLNADGTEFEGQANQFGTDNAAFATRSHGLPPKTWAIHARRALDEAGLTNQPLTPELLQRAGISIHPDFEVKDGQLRQRPSRDKSDWFVDIAGAGTGAVVGGALIGGLLAGGGAAGGAGSVGGAAAPTAASAVPGATGVGTTAATTAGGVLPSTPLATTGIMTAPGLPMSAAPVAQAGGIMGKLGGLWDKWGDKAGILGDAISDATTAAKENRRLENELGVRVNDTNISGRSAYERQLNERAELENMQRKQSLADVYRAGWYQNRKPGPYNPQPFNPLSQNYMDSLSALEQEGVKRVGTPAQYNTQDFTPLKPYEDYKPKGSGVLEKFGDWAGPILTTGGKIFGRGGQ